MKYFAILMVLLMGCQGRPVLSGFPTFLQLKITEKGVEFQFDELVTLSKVGIEPPLAFTVEGEKLFFQQPAEIGGYYEIIATAKNQKGHKTRFKTHFYGYNPTPANLIFNEFTIMHSAKYPERIEFYVEKAGNLAGLMLVLGDQATAKSRFIFPHYPVKQGDFITVVCRGEELLDNTFLWTDIKGLPNQEGLLMLFYAETGEVMDALAYSTTGEFSVKLAEQVNSQNITIQRVITQYTTPTRSLSRQTDGHWIVTKTSGATFGFGNSSQTFVAPVKAGS